MMEINLWFSMTFLLGLCTVSMNAQDPAYWQLTDEHGLPSRTVYDILQDSTGYIWMATSNGISRFDGRTVVNISNQGLKDNEILKIEKDVYNNIWFTNLSGQLGNVVGGQMNILDALIDDYRSFEFGILDNFIYVKQRYKEIKKINRFEINQQGELVSSFQFDEEFFTLPSQFISQDKGFVFVGSRPGSELQGLYYLGNEANEITLIEEFSEDYKSLRYENAFSDLVYDWANNSLFIGKPGKFKKIFEFDGGNGLSSAERINGNLFLMLKKGAILNVPESSLSKDKIVLNNIPCNRFFVDREKNYWIATTGNGVIIIPTPMLTTYNTENSSLPNDKIYTLYAEGDKLLIGQNGGYITSLVKNEIISSQKLKTSDRITNIIKDHDSNYWIAADNYLLTTDVDLKLLGMSRESPKKIFQDSRDNIWIGSNYSIERIDASNVNVKGQNIRDNREDVLKSRTYAFEEDEKANVWMGTTRGLYYYNDSLHPFLADGQHYTHSISDLEFSEDAVLWVATLGDGVIAIKDGVIHRRYNTSNGLSSNACKKLFIDNDQIWIASDMGLNSITVASSKVQVINKTDGLSTNNINDVLVDGEEVWVGTSKGLINLQRTTNTFNAHPPPVHISKLKIWGRDTIINKALKLNYDQNNFEIEFNGLSFRARGGISYKYKLSGVDQQWVYTSSKFVRYPKILPGEYEFVVYAINEDGVEGELPASVAFEINKAWWNTWLFRIALLLLLIGTISRILQLRWRALRNKHAQQQSFQQKVNELEQRALQTQMNPHFIFNSLNAIQQYVTSRDTERAMLYLGSFARLVRMIFEHSKSKSISLDQEIDFINLYLGLEKLRFKDRVQVEVIIDEAIEKEAYRIQLPPLLLQPLIENAFKHGLFHKKEKGQLRIQYSRVEKYLVCVITDNGVGRKAANALKQSNSRARSSSGIKTSRERLAIINEGQSECNAPEDLQIVDLLDENNKARGTQVIVNIHCIPN